VAAELASSQEELSSISESYVNTESRIVVLAEFFTLITSSKTV
jgi:hypothetical protein